jgi:spermidine synthase
MTATIPGPRRQAPLSLLFLLVFCSGVTGLTYQVLWVRMHYDALGITVLAMVTVVAVFMGGLALGSLLFGRMVDRVSSPARLYGLLEIGIGVSAVLLLPLLSLFTSIFDSVQRQHELSFGLQTLARVLYSGSVLLAPTVLMGGTFPALCRYLVPTGERGAGRTIGAVYGVNTLGAVGGALVAGFVLIEALGIRSSVLVTAALNLIVGVAALFLFPGVREADGKEDRESAPAAAPAGGDRREGDPDGSVIPIVLAVSLISGFVSIGYEVFWSKALVFFIGNSTYAVSLTLASFLFGIAFGSLVYARIERRIKRPFLALGVCQIAVGVAGALTVPVLCKLFYSADWLPLSVHFEVSAYESVPWIANILRIALTCLFVMVVPTTIMGIGFPLAAAVLVRARRDVGRSLGNLYAINTLGSILGAAVSGTVVIALFGVQKGILALAFFNLVAGVLVFHRSRPRERLFLASIILLFLALAAGSARFLTLPAGFRSESESPRDAVLFYDEGIAGIVKVYKKPTGAKLMSVDGAVIGSTADELQLKQKILAHLPAVLAKETKSALAVGLGSGITLGVLGLHDTFDVIDAIEIVPEVVEGAALFERDNFGILNDPRTTMRIGDGVVYLRTTLRSYDVISSDPKLNHSYVGNAAVYSSTYYRHCLDRLNEGGIMCQWVPTLLPSEDWKTVARTFLSVFPYVSIWFFEPSHAIMVGSDAPLRVDPSRIDAALADPDVRADLAAFGLDSPGAILGSFLAADDSLRRYVGEGPIHTFDRPTLEFRLPRTLAERPLHLVEADNLEAMIPFAGDVRDHLAPGAWDALAPVEREEIVRSLDARAPFLAGVVRSTREAQFVAGRVEFTEAGRIAPADGRVRILLERIRSEETSLAGRAGGGGDPVALLRLGIHRFQEDRFDEARVLFEEALAAKPDLVEAWIDLGAALERLGRIDEAVEAWRRAIRLRPDERRPYLNLAAALRLRGENDDALALLEECRARAGENAALHYQMGETYAALGKTEDARRHAELAVRADPEEPRFRDLLRRIEGGATLPPR